MGATVPKPNIYRAELRATEYSVLTPQMGPQAIEVRAETISAEHNGLGIIVGKETNALRGLMVITGVIQLPFDKLKVLIQSTKGIIQIKPEEPVAQMLIMIGAQDVHGPQGEKFAALSLSLADRPLWTLTIRGKSIQGLLDTGADVSIISENDWPKSWPLQPGDNTLVGLGAAMTPSRSAQVLHWQDQEGNKGNVQPYVSALPITLWGRDILEQLGLTLTNEDQLESSTGRRIMYKKGYQERGLGSREGRRDLAQPKGDFKRQDTGFSWGPLRCSRCHCHGWTTSQSGYHSGPLPRKSWLR